MQQFFSPVETLGDFQSTWLSYWHLFGRCTSNCICFSGPDGDGAKLIKMSKILTCFSCTKKLLIFNSYAFCKLPFQLYRQSDPVSWECNWLWCTLFCLNQTLQRKLSLANRVDPDKTLDSIIKIYTICLRSILSLHCLSFCFRCFFYVLSCLPLWSPHVKRCWSLG